MQELLLVIIYIVSSYAAAKIGKKFGVGTTWQYFIPIYNHVLLCRCAKISGWWVIGLFVPAINLAVMVYIYGSVAKKLGKNFWLYGLGGLLFAVTLYIMAWDKSQPISELPAGESML